MINVESLVLNEKGGAYMSSGMDIIAIVMCVFAAGVGIFCFISEYLGKKKEDEVQQNEQVLKNEK